MDWRATWAAELCNESQVRCRESGAFPAWLASLDLALACKMAASIERVHGVPVVTEAESLTWNASCIS